MDINTYKTAAQAVVLRLGEQHPEELKLLDSVKAGEIGIVKGQHDSVENIIKTCLNLPATVESSIPKASTVLFLNCGNAVDSKAVEQFARDGGWVASSDWALTQITQAFPGVLRKTPRNTGDETVGVEAITGSLWSEVTVPGTLPEWWLEGSSYNFEILQPEVVQVEAASYELMQKYGTPHVAVQFPWGRGRVFHVISHFFHKRTSPRNPRHAEPAANFLKEGMGLSEDSISKISGLDKCNFGSMQTAVTSTELIARFVIAAKKSAQVPCSVG